jgi:hypothetical protein
MEAISARDVAVARTTAWARATMDHWGLGGLASDVALIVAEFSCNAWMHGSPPVTVTLLLQDSVLTVEVSDAGAGLAVFAGPRPLGAGGRGLPAAVDVAQQIGIDGGAWGTRVWARLHFQWIPAQTEPGTAAA